MLRSKRLIGKAKEIAGNAKFKESRKDGKGPKENGQKPDQIVEAKRGKRKLPNLEGTPSKQRKVEEKGVEIRSFRRHNRGPGFVTVQGNGDVGQLGLGEDVLERKRPSRLPLEKKFVDVCAGGMHTVCLTNEGEVYTFGCNDEGALGRDTSKEGSEFIPGIVEVPGLVVQVSAGDSHTAALTDDGRVFIWGNFRDSKGAMGLLVKEQQQTRPLHILPLVRVQKIASGSDHLVLLSHDGFLYTSGCGEQGQLGRVAECFTNRGGRKGLEMLLSPGRVKVAKSKKFGTVVFDDIWAGFHATFARAKDSGNIYACGLNNYNQIGFQNMNSQFTLQIVPSFLNKQWKRIACGLHHTLLLDDSGHVYSMGRKEYGRLGLGTLAEDCDSPVVIPTLKKCLDISCGISTSYAVTEDGQLFAWGMGLGEDEGDEWEPVEVKGKQLENCQAIAASAGGQHVVFLAVSEN